MIKYILSDSKFQPVLEEWKSFLDLNFTVESDIKILFDSECPQITDSENRKLRIDFNNDTENYNKFKSNITSEPLSRALGSGKKGLKVLDLSAGMGIDSLFLVQLGYTVSGIERNALLYLALMTALKNSPDQLDKKLTFKFSEANIFLKTSSEKFDVCYFDPMFPQKKKSALPKQEMIMFKNLVGPDSDATEVLQTAITTNQFNRIVVKRPIGAEPLLKPSGAIEGKIIRYDIYG